MNGLCNISRHLGLITAFCYCMDQTMTRVGKETRIHEKVERRWTFGLGQVLGCEYCCWILTWFPNDNEESGQCSQTQQTAKYQKFKTLTLSVLRWNPYWPLGLPSKGPLAQPSLAANCMTGPGNLKHSNNGQRKETWRKELIEIPFPNLHLSASQQAFTLGTAARGMRWVAAIWSKSPWSFTAKWGSKCSELGSEQRWPSPAVADGELSNRAISLSTCSCCFWSHFNWDAWNLP